MKNIEEFIKDFIDLKEIKKIDFKKVCGFYFAIQTTHITIKNEISSSEIKPIAIIYEENDQYYFAPLYGQENINEIVKNYVEDLKHNE
jgi:hypothetical protein